MTLRKLLIPVVACSCALLVPAAALAYTIVFKDESTLVTLQKYTIEGDSAIVILPSGTKTSFPAAEIDIEKSDELNRLGGSRGIVINGGVDRTPVSARPNRTSTADLVRTGGGLQLPKEREQPIARTRAGNLDLFTLKRSPPDRPELATAVEGAYKALGVRGFDIWAGTRVSYLLVEKQTENEIEVFAALTTSAQALLSARVDQPELEALELLMATSSRVRAAQFLLTPEAAQRLVDNEISPVDFFLLNVQF